MAAPGRRMRRRRLEGIRSEMGGGRDYRRRRRGWSGQRARPGAGGFPLPEGVSRAAGPLDGDPMALAGLIARSHRSGPQTLSVLCSLDKIRCWSKTRRIFD